MQNALSSLKKIMDKQIALYIQLLELTQKEQSALVENKPELLPNLLDAEDELVNSIEEIELVRKETFAVIANVLGIERSDLTLRKLIGHLPEPYSASFENDYNRLAQTIDSLSFVNKLNIDLINNALRYSDFLVNLLTQRQEKSSSYSSEGTAVLAGSNNIVDFNS